MSMRDYYCGDVTEVLAEQKVALCGWVYRRREHSNVVFIDLRDRSGIVQVICDKADNPELYALANNELRSEYCIQVIGTVRKRTPETVNEDLPTGRVEVVCSQLNVLNPSMALPFQLDD